MIKLSRRRTLDPAQTIHRYREMTLALEPLFEQMHEIITEAGFRPFGELQVSFPNESHDVETQINWESRRP